MKCLIKEIWSFARFTFEYLDDPAFNDYGVVFNEDGYPVDFSEVAWRSRFYLALWDIAIQSVLITICHYNGHKWDVSSNCGPESGSEDFYCERCHRSEHIRYY